MARSKKTLARLVSALLVLAGISPQAEAQTIPTAGTRWEGLSTGPYVAGFELRQSLDQARVVNRTDRGLPMGLTIWYPASTPSLTPAPSVLDYRLLQFATPLTPLERTAYADQEASAMAAWRHVGIVPMTLDQARASLGTRGMASPGAVPAPGRFPVVVVLGGPHYLATTAEVLASYGFLVVAPFRFVDTADETAVAGFSYSSHLEASVADAEWALQELATHPAADLAHVGAMGHGGGGASAMLLAMRNRQIDALATIDAGNFSERSALRDKPFYSTRLMQRPFLYLATAATRRSQDLFADFEAMRFSDRYVVTLENSELRHHDLSDFGRGVTSPLALRGEAQTSIGRDYADVQLTTARFFQAHLRADSAAWPVFAEWLVGRAAAGRLSVEVRPGVEPAPTPGEVLAALDANTPRRLRDAHRSDPDAVMFQADQLTRIALRLLAVDAASAEAVAAHATEIHRTNVRVHALYSLVLEQRGETTRAILAAEACVAMNAGSDWQAIAAVGMCRDRIARLRPGGS